MSFYTPNTTVYLCNVPINSNQKNQFVPYTSGNSVWNAEGQRNWFLNQNHLKHSFTDFTYQRKDNIIRVPVNAEVLFADGSNYVVYQNQHYHGKWFYCFITKIEFINENMTALHIKTDVFQTWFFEFYKSNHMDINFIARETVIKDEMFKHTLPENIGDIQYTALSDNSFPYAVVSEETLQQKLSAVNSTNFDDNYYACIFTSELIRYVADILPSIDSYVGGSPCPCYIYATDLQGYWALIDKINDNGQANAVVKCVAIPKFMCKYHPLTGGGDEPITPQPPSQSGLHLNSPFSGTIHIEQTYGWQYPSGSSYWHDGMDMWCISGDDNVYSTVKGTVVYSAFHEGDTIASSFGELVCIKDDVTGYYFLFGHLALGSRGVSYGQRVNIGDYLGITGGTGAAQGAVHLHYEVNTTDMWSNSVNPTTVADAQFPNTTGDY